MELSKRALGFLCRQYRIILSQNRLANALGTCALSALVGVTMCATGAFVAPESALAGTSFVEVIGEEVPSDTSSWSSMGNISASSTESDVTVHGIMATPTKPISITLNSGHTLTVSSNVTEATNGANSFIATVTGISVLPEAMFSDSTIINNGTIKLTASAISTDPDADPDVNIEARAVGMNIMGIKNTLINNGSIQAISTGRSVEPTTGMSAVGILENTLSNEGTITIKAKTANDSANATGMNAEGAQKTILTNGADGTITVSAESTDSYADACGMYAYGGSMFAPTSLPETSPASQTSIDFTNSGTLTVKVKGANGSPYAYGMYASGAQKNVFTNGADGTITVSAESTDSFDQTCAQAWGMYAEAGSGVVGLSLLETSPASQTSIDFINNGTMTVTTNTGSSAQVFGMNATGAQKTILTNGGTMTVTANGTDSYANAVGMFAEGGGSGGIERSQIKPNPASQTSIDVTNSGTMNVNAKAKVVEGGDEVSANAVGMVAMGGGGVDIRSSLPQSSSTSSGTVVNLTNNGTMNISAEGPYVTAYGMHASFGGAIFLSMPTLSSEPTPPSTVVNLTNKGIMNVDAIVTGTDDRVNAAGMYVQGSDDVVATINNFGVINVSATSNSGSANAYQAYIESGSANVGTWAITLGESYGEDMGYHVFGVASGATLNFGLNDQEGATLIINSVLEGGFEPNKKYEISDMIGGTGTVTGYIESVTSPFTFVDLKLVNEGTANDYKDQYITGSVNITKDNSPTHGAATTTLAGATSHMNGLNNVVSGLRGNTGGAGGAQDDMHSAKSDTAMMYADASTTFTDAGGSYLSPESPVWKAFLMPFYSTTSENGGAYNTDMTGLVVGANRNVGDDFVFGFHASLAKANSESTSTDSDTISYALGVNGVYNVDESLYVRGQLTGFYAVNDLDMVSGTGPLAQKAFADMDTYGLYAQLAAGYDFALAPKHVLTPELALSYMYAHMEGFNSEFTSAFGNTPFSMDSEDYNALYADASLRWTGAFDLGNRENGKSLGTLKPTVKAGVRQALTDPEISSTMNIFGESATTHADANETAFTCEAGLAWVMDDVTLSATYMGEFGDVEYSHMGMFKVEWEF